MMLAQAQMGEMFRSPKPMRLRASVIAHCKMLADGMIPRPRHATDATSRETPRMSFNFASEAEQGRNVPEERPVLMVAK